MVGDAFVRGMRDIGYKSTPYALAELIDNAIQASATGSTSSSASTPAPSRPSIAVIDDGYGMEPKMVRAALVWGAEPGPKTAGFGKYGYGLPSASVSQCHRVTVFPRPPRGLAQALPRHRRDQTGCKWNVGSRIRDAREQARGVRRASSSSP